MRAEQVAAPMVLDDARQMAEAAAELQARLRGQVKVGESMRRHTTFHIGGPADIFVVPKELEDLIAVVRFSEEKGLPLRLVGNGSNLLVGDGGIRGLVVRLAPNFSAVGWRAEGVVVGAGMRLQVLLKLAAQQGMSGLESLVSIPGTVGGALVMNAGTDVGTIGDLVTGATVVDRHGTVRQLGREELAYGYRRSVLRTGELIVVEAELRLAPAPPEEVQAKMDRLRLKREGRQPLSAWSAGSAFKNPRGVAAGKILERAGAKGKRFGEAQISPKHANFLVNRGHARAAEVRALMEWARALAQRRYEIELEPEIEQVGEG